MYIKNFNGLPSWDSINKNKSPNWWRTESAPYEIVCVWYKVGCWCWWIGLHIQNKPYILISTFKWTKSNANPPVILDLPTEYLVLTSTHKLLSDLLLYISIQVGCPSFSFNSLFSLIIFVHSATTRSKGTQETSILLQVWWGWPWDQKIICAGTTNERFTKSG